ETQHANTDLGSEATISQSETNSVVDWNCLSTTDLRAMCLRCNIPVKGTKTELVSRLEIYWKEPEKDCKAQGTLKGKLAEQTQAEGHEKRDGHPMQEGIEGKTGEKN
ncbi:5200_t:CDS:1, partial [Gigaspora margarita]